MSEATTSSGKYPPAPRARRAAPVAATLVQGVSGTITIAGFPLSTWAFALRIWAAMMVALYAAFWLQLESASLGHPPQILRRCCEQHQEANLKMPFWAPHTWDCQAFRGQNQFDKSGRPLIVRFDPTAVDFLARQPGVSAG